jgi:hypothetical protein
MSFWWASWRLLYIAWGPSNKKRPCMVASASSYTHYRPCDRLPRLLVKNHFSDRHLANSWLLIGRWSLFIANTSTKYDVGLNVFRPKVKEPRQVWCCSYKQASLLPKEAYYKLTTLIELATNEENKRGRVLPEKMWLFILKTPRHLAESQWVEDHLADTHISWSKFKNQ